MTHYLILMAFAALFIQGFNYCIQYDPFTRPEGRFEEIEIGAHNKEIFWFIKFYGQKLLPKVLWKPFFNCPVCMASVYGSLFYWADIFAHASIVNSRTLAIWFVFCVCLAGMNRIITKFIHS